MADTGNTSTLTFGTTGFTAQYRRLGGTEQTREKLKNSHLGTTTRETYQPGDLIEPGEFEAELYWDQSAAVKPPITGASETITRTFPLKTGESSAATEAGTGFVVMVSGPDLVNNELMMARIRVAWSGVTGPTYTSGS